MGNATENSGVLIVIDPYEIGWWIESTDEELYGPVSRATLRRFLEQGDVSPNTLVRHATQPEAKPIADQPGMTTGVKLEPRASAIGDRMGKVWPRKSRDQLALAVDSLPCNRHKQKAVSFCVRCQAPYCSSCRQKPYRKQFYFCRHCQASNHNRRFVALLLDSAVFNYAPLLVAIPVAQVTGEGILILFQVAGGIAFLLRDALFRGAGPGKRVMGLRVVQIQNETAPLSYGQGILRWLSQLIPVFNLFDAFAPLSDPLQRRYGDRWAKTRVIDTESKLRTARRKVQGWLAKKGFMPAAEAALMTALPAQHV